MLPTFGSTRTIMRTSAILTSGCMLALGPATAQPPPGIQWESTFGGGAADVPEEVVQVSDGGYVIVGSTSSLDDYDVSGHHGVGPDVWAIKVSASGALLWQRCLGGGSGEQANAVVATPDNGVILAGMTDSEDGDALGCVIMPFGRSWVVRLDSLGDVVWKNCDNEHPVHDLALTPDGGCIAVGGLDDDVVVSKLDAQGITEWSYGYGGPGNEKARGVQLTEDGGYMVAAETNQDGGDVSGFHGDQDLWLLKLDAVGFLQWQRCLGGTGLEVIHDMVRTTDGGYVLGGTTTSSDGDVQGLLPPGSLWVVKVDAVGDIVWQHCRAGRSYPNVTSLNDGTFLCTSLMDLQAILERWDEEGDLLWGEAYFTSAMSVGNVCASADGGYVWCLTSTLINCSSQFQIVKLQGGGLATAVAHAVPAPFTVRMDEAQGLLVVTTSHGWSGTTIALLDASGRNVRSATIGSSQTALDVGTLAAGVYVVQLTNGQVVQTRPVIIR